MQSTNRSTPSRRNSVATFFSILVSILLGPALSSSIAADPPKPVRIFILAGQSNMEGKAKLSLLNHQATQPTTEAIFAKYRRNGEWIQRDDVWIKFLERSGRLTIGYGSPDCIGPELAFGWTMGDRFNEPVLLIKIAWGGRSLWRDFRPPSAGLPSESALQKILTEQQKQKPETTREEVVNSFGTSYRLMLDEVKQACEGLHKYVPGHGGNGFVFGGFVWFQGWNDMINREYTAEYATNMMHFIRDVRRDLRVAHLPFVIAQMGVEGTNASKNIATFKSAQATAAAAPEFQGNVALVKTDQFWDYEAEAVFKNGWKENLDAWNRVGSDYPYHYLGSARTLCGIGSACAEAILDVSR